MSREARDNESEHLSVSQANSCLARVAFERIAEIREAAGPALNLGSYIHSLAERAYRRAAEPAPIPAGMDKKSAGFAKHLFAGYWQTIGARIAAADPELHAEIRFEFFRWTKRPIIGYIDLIYSVAGQTIPADIKTKSRAPDAISPEEKLQLATYRAALGLPIPGPAELHIILTDGQGEVYTLESDEAGVRGITPEDIERTRLRFQALDAAWESRRFRPEPSPLCRYCPAYEHCQEGRVFDGDINAFIKARSSGGDTRKDFRKEKVMVKIEKSGEIRPYLKIALTGEPGTLKTRTALAFPSPLVVDTEMGTDHYIKEFDFQRVTTTHPKVVSELIRQVAKEPGDVKTFVIDSWSVYCEAVQSWFVDRFMEKETGGKGHKGDYYQLQPRDYQPINREMMKQVKALLKLNMHLILVMQEKDEYTGMEKTGTTYDGYKRSAHYCDVDIRIKRVRDPKTGAEVLVGVVRKDRTHCLPARIEPFSIEKLREAWKVYFDRKAEPSGEVFDEPAETTSTPEAPKAPAPAAAEAGPVIEEPLIPAKKADKIAALLELKAMFAIPEDKWIAALAKRKVKTPEKLTGEALDEILSKLEENFSPSALANWRAAHPWRATAPKST